MPDFNSGNENLYVSNTPLYPFEVHWTLTHSTGLTYLEVVSHSASFCQGWDHAVEAGPHLNGFHVLVDDNVEGKDAVEETGFRDVTAGIGIVGYLSLLLQAAGLLRKLDPEYLAEVMCSC